MIHVISKFASGHGGTEMRAIELYRLLATRAKARLWSTGPPSPDLPDDAPITQIDPGHAHLPLFGTFVFVGVYFHVGRWIRATMPSRQIVIVNTATQDGLNALRRQILWPGFGKSYEIVYACTELLEAFGLPGVVQESPIDIERFSPGAPQCGTFTAGRLSRDYRYKFHEADPELFTRLVDAGINLRLMGGTVLRDEMPASENLELLAPGIEAPQVFLRSLDCFVYRTRSDYFETYGRVVFEAMACGIPVICSRIGGYARFIEHGVNGFLFDTTDEAVRFVVALKNDRDLRARIGGNARRTIEQIYSEVYKNRIVEFYTGLAQFPITNATPPLFAATGLADPPTGRRGCAEGRVLPLASCARVGSVPRSRTAADS
jgi:glycosyltransferase involved in cell wall biosynthesis